MLDRFARPALTAHLQVRALELNQHALRLLRDETSSSASGQGQADRARALFASTTAGAACWQSFRFLLEAERWQAVKQSLEEQDRLLQPVRAVEAGVVVSFETGFTGLAAHARKPGEQRCLAELIEQVACEGSSGLSRRQGSRLESLLLDQSRWLNEMVAGRPEGESLVVQGMVRIYGRAKRSVEQDAYAGKSRRRLACLAWSEELLAVPWGQTEEPRPPASAAGRLWMGLEEYRWLRLLADTAAARALTGKNAVRLTRLIRRRRRELAHWSETLMPAVVGHSVRDYAAGLPWRVFHGLADVPDPL